VTGGVAELSRFSPIAALDWRITEVGLTGTKLGCGEGGCGACTVMLSAVEEGGRIVHRSANACLCPLYAVEGMHVVTVEGKRGASQGLRRATHRPARLATRASGLNPTQAWATHGRACIQCRSGWPSRTARSAASGEWRVGVCGTLTRQLTPQLNCEELASCTGSAKTS
jgi:aerobic-type carbon monoxide dehydrogenase small subunit (CoxS/CutS family)